ncbi:MAG TPA: SEC-C metal-binding domain-containing protein [Thermoanaerobaculia bacterium]|nr:SEC-C metal-binding domain-containing protein [Thermoanaerobaculia bacterium]
METGRNDACPCGSGKKFKNCCIGEAKRRSSRGLMFLIAAIALIAAAGVVPQMLEGDQPKRTPVPAASRSAGGAGKVWSPEHNHWHDAATPAATPASVPARPITPPPAQQTFTPKPQPPGPVPARKVWSTEHGHWHDVNAK